MIIAGFDELLFLFFQRKIKLNIFLFPVIDDIEFSFIEGNWKQVGEQRAFIKVKMVSVLCADFFGKWKPFCMG